MKFTDKATAGLELPAGSKDFVWWDDDIKGFGIRLREGGSRNWIYRYRIGSKQRSLILGSAKSVPLGVVRKNASTLEAKVRLGGDPALDKQNARLEADNTVGVLAEQYLETRKSEWRPSTHTEIRRHLTEYAKSTTERRKSLEQHCEGRWRCHGQSCSHQSLQFICLGTRGCCRGCKRDAV
jgi:hypothetical protein